MAIKLRSADSLSYSPGNSGEPRKIQTLYMEDDDGNTVASFTVGADGNTSAVLPVDIEIGDDLDITDNLTVGGTIAVTGTSSFTGQVTESVEANGALGAGAAAATGNVATETIPVVHKTVLTLTAVEITVGNTTGVSFGSVKVYDFPEGRIHILGAILDLEAPGLGNVGNATPIDGDDNGDISMGTTAASDGTLSGTDVDIIPSTALAFDTAVTSALADDAQFDGTTTAVDAYINMLVDDGDVGDGASDIIELTGTVTITWINLGDY